MKILLLILLAAALGSTAPSLVRSNTEPAGRLVEEAVKDIHRKRLDLALEKLLKAEKLNPHSAVILNLLGAVCTKQKNYPAAKIYFERSLAHDPGFFPPAFNLGELLFLDHQYALALDAFSRMLSANPGNELLQFKTILCLLLADRAEEARKLLLRMNFPLMSPAWYYAHAAFQIKKDNLRAAKELLASARISFPNKTALYDETFENLGWPTR